MPDFRLPNRPKIQVQLGITSTAPLNVYSTVPNPIDPESGQALSVRSLQGDSYYGVWFGYPLADVQYNFLEPPPDLPPLPPPP